MSEDEGKKKSDVKPKREKSSKSMRQPRLRSKDPSSTDKTMSAPTPHRTLESYKDVKKKELRDSKDSKHDTRLERREERDRDHHKDHKEPRDSRRERTKEHREPKEHKESSRDRKEHKDLKDSKDSKHEAKIVTSTKDTKEHREPKEHKESSRDRKEHKDLKDSKDSKHEAKIEKREEPHATIKDVRPESPRTKVESPRNKGESPRRAKIIDVPEPKKTLEINEAKNEVKIIETKENQEPKEIKVESPRAKIVDVPSEPSKAPASDSNDPGRPAKFNKEAKRASISGKISGIRKTFKHNSKKNQTTEFTIERKSSAPATDITIERKPGPSSTPSAPASEPGPTIERKVNQPVILSNSTNSVSNQSISHAPDARESITEIRSNKTTTTANQKKGRSNSFDGGISGPTGIKRVNAPDDNAPKSEQISANNSNHNKGKEAEKKELVATQSFITAELEYQCREAFDMYDFNQNGTVLKEDGIAVVRSIGLNPSDEQMKKAMETVSKGNKEALTVLFFYRSLVRI
eukprot:TRINITY_DN829_c0_g1_i1.p1 TRINITY_DN829_c0_g1~~TRINITY_DN829_c0_g1_i1.p1  ORF type:complete len:520 (+),score=158.65 TRINITY_DN829_c0_g1_i1:79-1638(+)